MADHPNLELIKKGYNAFANQDMETLNELFADDIVWHVPGNNPLAGDYKGKDEVFGFFMKLAELTQGSFKFDFHDFLANDDHGVAILTAHAERNGKSLNNKNVHIFHMKDGKLTEFWGMTDEPYEVDAFYSD